MLTINPLRHRALIGGLLLVFLLQTLAWSSIPLRAQSSSDLWITVCTALGIERVAISSSGEPEDGGPHSVAPHCDLCVFAQGLGTAFPPLRVPGAHVGTVQRLGETPKVVVLRGLYARMLARAPPFLEQSLLAQGV